MKFYHLADKGKGLQLEFLGEFDGFDTASDAADKQVSDGNVGASIWILDEICVRVLFDSMLAAGCKEGTHRLPENFVKEYGDIAKTTTMMGLPMDQLDRESLMASAVWGYKALDTERKQHMSSIDLMAAIGEKRKKL